MGTEVSSAPLMAQLQSVQKALAIPTVGAAVGQVGSLYTKVKGAHSLLEWALSSAEAGVGMAAPYVAAPLAASDARLAAAIDSLAQKVPLVREQPEVIKRAVVSTIKPHLTKVCGARAAAEQRVKSLKELSWTKANALLSTAYGKRAMHNIDSGATYAMQLLDHYLPPVDGSASQEPSKEAVSCAMSPEPALHAVQTVGRLGAVAARRVWANLARKVNDLRTSGVELDVRRYSTALAAALHLAAVTGAPRPHHSSPTTDTKVNSTPHSESLDDSK